MCEPAGVILIAGSALIACRAYRGARRAAAYRRAILTLGQPIVVDGYLGRQTTMAMQKVLSDEGISVGPIDGSFGQRTRAATQTYLKALGYDVGPVDGWWGRRSTRALQAWLREVGANPGPVDGHFGKRTVAALQTVLNSIYAAPREADAPAEEAEAPPMGEVIQATPVQASRPIVADGLVLATVGVSSDADANNLPVAVVAGLPVVSGTAA